MADQPSKPLKNARHERAAQELAMGADQITAYIDAGFAGGHGSTVTSSNAARLFKRPEIVARVEWLKEQGAKRAKKTIEEMLLQLDDDRNFARREKSPTTALQATTVQCKVLGYLSEKQEHRFTDKDGNDLNFTVNFVGGR